MERVTLHTIRSMKERGERITMLTAYDYPTALLLDEAGVDMLLVGDSLGMVVHGFENTLPVTLEMMLLHCQAVRRGTKRALVVVDMPFMTYQISTAEAMRNAARLLAEGGADAVKLEGGRRVADTVRALVEAGIAVQGHIGLTPQSVSAFGGMRVQGKTVEAARQLLDDALALEDAGVFSLVLEGIPARLAELITRRVSVPTIGIGAGAGCDGQVLVTHDLLGLFERFTPRFVKRYATLANIMRSAFKAYCDEVRAGTFPAEEHTYPIPNEVWQAIEAELDHKS
ncbi:MAG: 3-methyl-2-oxobutanoate hydroxymethyltransferase [Aggregatilineales bacterium]|jgi:3-methyl-2-oxobutanoate hydroxymethyltransferase|nr:3-methyl-2-oxobutanoate hydroxymethyltransferase [Chloroflexota bacterium]HOA23592.1 3-methyl-2-oxobutanoate hydroxymethyltransferase [Aggregatilineales bacterium]HPV05523.1 3-methyl-2-oxobutanoate hydroxymethyltransferase [Aggregatilineales bacterium]HQE19503.1 3-methyl-2-oxobutanoate hydroxymethyltransferase [Aggregatilineales bacterium]